MRSVPRLRGTLNRVRSVWSRSVAYCAAVSVCPYISQQYGLDRLSGTA